MGGLSEALLRFALSLTGRDRPRVALLPTAGGDGDSGIVRMYELLATHAVVEVVRLFGVPERPCDRDRRRPRSPRSGRQHREHARGLARSRCRRGARGCVAGGTVLAGWSAGATAGSSRRHGLVRPRPRSAPGRPRAPAGKLCPHYDGETFAARSTEARRRGSGPGYAADDCAGFHFEGTRCERSSPRGPTRRGIASSRDGTPLPGRLVS